MQKQPVKIIFFMLLLWVVTLACNTVNNGIFPTPTYISIAPLPVTAQPSPTIDPSLPPRWIEYERALSSVLLGPIGNTVPDLESDHGLCEWIFMGGKGEQIYAWAECENDEGTATSAPVVIFLGEDGHIKAVVMPDEGWGNIEELFPAPVVEMIYSNPFNAKAAMEHIRLRRADPSIPPIIVLEGGTLP
ncbi:MAG: hypothetical protein HZB50_17825 [Chloroflexi bacterium]|nr:hypothetical protein [Chloroflexota bacterium]